MTAVSQTYPNYLGGLNEQPDEVKKPGQLQEAVNVIPDLPLVCNAVLDSNLSLGRKQMVHLLMYLMLTLTEPGLN